MASFLANLHHFQPTPTIDPLPVNVATTPPLTRLTPCRATWLLRSPQEDLTAEQQSQAQLVAHLAPDIEQIATQAQSFAHLLRQRLPDGLDPWLASAGQSAVHELRTFARGVQRDYAAVKAAFSSPFSNGPVEGQVNRLKSLKRQMFGRASFDLLRIRVLSQAPPRRQQKCA